MWIEWPSLPRLKWISQHVSVFNQRTPNVGQFPLPTLVKGRHGWRAYTDNQVMQIHMSHEYELPLFRFTALPYTGISNVVLAVDATTSAKSCRPSPPLRIDKKH